MLQKECDIGPDETIGEVYFNKLFPMGVQAMLEAADLVYAASGAVVDTAVVGGRILMRGSEVPELAEIVARAAVRAGRLGL